MSAVANHEAAALKQAQSGGNQVIFSSSSEPIPPGPPSEFPKDDSRFSDLIPCVYNFRSLREDIARGDTLSAVGHGLGLVGEAILTVITVGQASEALAALRAGSIAVEEVAVGAAETGVMATREGLIDVSQHLSNFWSRSGQRGHVFQIDDRVRKWEGVDWSGRRVLSA